MNKSILIIDDDMSVTRSLDRLLSKEAYSATIRQNGREALDDIAQDRHFDLIICDIRLPGMNGVEVARKIKRHLKDNNKPDVPVIFITGYSDKDLHVKAQEMGSLFTKPFENKELLEGIKIAIERVPHNAKLDYTKEFIQKRREWLSEKTGTEFSHIPYYSSNPEEFKGNTENFIGISQVPTGIVGPVLVNGDFAKGTFYVPFATTEGALIETYQRGAIATTKAGGINVFVGKDANHLDPIFIFRNSTEARNFLSWLNDNKQELKKAAESTTGFGELISVTPHLVGKRVIIDMAYYTNDAMGANMINIATEKVCEFITSKVEVQRYLLRSNFSSEKKASPVNLLIGYGKEVTVEATIPKKIISRFLFTTPEDIHQAWHSWAISSFHSAILGPNAHFANGLAAIFTACGQDIAHVVNASVGIQSYELTESGDLYACLKLPNIVVGTVGGGTALSTQRECLEMLGCYGKGKAKKFAEIIGATLLAGEIGICAGITSEHFLDPHKRARVHTRKKAFG